MFPFFTGTLYFASLAQGIYSLHTGNLWQSWQRNANLYANVIQINTHIPLQAYQVTAEVHQEMELMVEMKIQGH